MVKTSTLRATGYPVFPATSGWGSAQCDLDRWLAGLIALSVEASASAVGSWLRTTLRNGARTSADTDTDHRRLRQRTAHDSIDTARPQVSRRVPPRSCIALLPSASYTDARKPRGGWGRVPAGAGAGAAAQAPLGPNCRWYIGLHPQSIFERPGQRGAEALRRLVLTPHAPASAEGPSSRRDHGVSCADGMHRCGHRLRRSCARHGLRMKGAAVNVAP